MKNNKIVWLLLIVVGIIIVVAIANKDNMASYRKEKDLKEQADFLQKELDFSMDIYEIKYGSDSFIRKMRRDQEIAKKYSK